MLNRNMAELEIHAEPHGADHTGQTVGLLAALLGVTLAVTTIASHRMHTAGIVHQNEANDRWSYYQAERLKSYTLELGEDLSGLLPESGKTRALQQRYRPERDRHEAKAKRIREEAEGLERDSRRDEQRALRYDWGEGLLEGGLVLTSLYFLSRKRLFPIVGASFGLIGAGVAVSALFL